MHFPGLLDRFPHESLQIKNKFLPASATGIFLGTFFANNNVKMLSALVAANQH
jgi:hypothetical protein